MKGIKIKFISSLKIIIFFKIIYYTYMLECNDTNIPLEKNGICVDNCTTNEITAGTCKINNEIIKVQWLNNIIYFAPAEYIYINVAVTETNNLYAITSDISPSNKRYLYVLNGEGNGFFGNEITTPFNIISNVGDSETKGRYESTSFTFKFYNPQKSYHEFLMSISKKDQNVEIFDFYNSKILAKKLISYFGPLDNIFSYVTAHLKLSNNEKLNVYLIGLLATESQDLDNNIDYFYLKKVKFNESYDAEIINETKVESYSGSNIVSCYETTTSFIVCFYRNQEKKYTMIVYTQDLEQKANLTFYDGNSNNKTFLKCVHFSYETGAFAYFTNDNQPLLKIQFKKYDNNQITDFYQSVPYLILNNYNLNVFVTLSDIAKVSNKKLYYVGTSIDNKILYIISIFNYHEEKFMTRIYSVNMYNFHNNCNFYKEIGIDLYKYMLVMGSSFLYGSDQTLYSSIIIFSYPNTTNVTFEISNYLFNNNDIKIYNLSVEINGEFLMENNIFGYIYTGIEFIDTKCSDLNEIYFTTENNENITSFYFLEKNKTIKLIIPKNDTYNIFTCKFRYACTVSEPEYSEFNKYPEKINFTGEINEEELYFDSQKTNYLGKYSYYSLYLDKELTEKDCEDNCELCSSNKSKCFTCKYSAIILEDKKICKNESILISSEIQFETEKITEFHSEIQSSEVQSTEIEKTNVILTNTKTFYEETNKISQGKEDNNTEKIYEKCNLEEIKNNNCPWDISNEQLKEMYKFIKENLIKKNETIVIETGNVIFEISTVNEQSNINNQNISNIDLGQCEVELKNKNNISESQSLIIFKIDIKSIDKKKTYVQYEVYHPTTYAQLNMSVCQDLTIDIYSPLSLSQLDSVTFHSLNVSGYNLYNPNDPFYNEICTPYTTINGTDILLSDRKVDIFSKSGNEALCQTGCELLYYDETYKKAKCNCKIKTKEENSDLINGFKFDKKEIEQSFFDTLSNSNFLVLKCYKLAFDLEKLLENKGRIMITLFLILFLILLFVYCFTGNKKLNYYLGLIIKQKQKLKNKDFNKPLKKKLIINSSQQKSELKRENNIMNNSSSHLKKSKSLKIIEDNNNVNKKQNYNQIERNKNKKEDHTKNDIYNIKSKIRKKDMLFPPKKKTNFNENSKNPLEHSKVINQNNIISINNNNNNEKMNKQNFHKDNLIKSEKLIFKNSNASLSIKQKDKDSENSSAEKNRKTLTEYEINSLTYELALIKDKRTYLQYYWSLLKQKHLLLFTFLPVNDFNLSSLKISLFILSFSLYFTINGFFFNDESMHKIYKENGAFNIICQIPQIIYSTFVSSIINLLLKTLSLSQKNILEIKKKKNLQIAIKESKKTKHCLQIKFIIFFILSFFLLLFFWYFISCFCGVYKNTQKILIKDTLISFGLSMLYPFGLNLLPGIFRIPSLRAKNKDKKCMYQVSGIIALI